jgi:hypothetical protein
MLFTEAANYWTDHHLGEELLIRVVISKGDQPRVLRTAVLAERHSEVENEGSILLEVVGTLSGSRDELVGINRDSKFLVKLPNVGLGPEQEIALGVHQESGVQYVGESVEVGVVGTFDLGRRPQSHRDTRI